jgi:hypothetical protein
MPTIDKTGRPPEMHDVRELPATLRGYPVHVLLSWARERILCPNAELREALRDPQVLAVLHDIDARERGLERSDRKVIA